MPTRPLLPGTFFTSQSIVSHASVLSSVSFVPLAGLNGRMCTNVPSEPYRPRTSCETRMKPSFASFSTVPPGPE